MQLDEMYVELGILRTLDHPSIINVYDLIQDDKNFYLVQELMQRGNLYQLIDLYGKKTGRNYLSEPQARVITR